MIFDIKLLHDLITEIYEEGSEIFCTMDFKQDVLVVTVLKNGSQQDCYITFKELKDAKSLDFVIYGKIRNLLEIFRE